ncbi:MAG: hypothetical protein EOO85_30515, partial [Pedobacter sp.]
GDPDEAATAKRELRKLFQGNRPITAYTADFLRISSQLDWDDAALKAAYRFGLSERVKDKLARIDEPLTRNHLVEVATRIDARLHARDLERKDLQERLPAFKKLLDQKIHEISALPADDINSEWKQFWISTRLYLPFILAEKKIVKAAPANAATLRDSLMAENLVWLVKEKYPKEKVIVWAASWHIGKSLDQKKIVSDKTYPLVMGDYIKNKIGSKLYSICFTAYDGEWAWYNMPSSHRIEVPSGDSFEEIFNQAGFNNAFMDFKYNRLATGGQWLEKKHNMRPYGYKEFSRRWPSIFDAVIFNNTMVRAVSTQTR